MIKTYPLATVISVKDNKPLITHLPLIYEDGKLIGHNDIYNPQAQLLKDDNDVNIILQAQLVTFHQAYTQLGNYQLGIISKYISKEK